MKLATVVFASMMPVFGGTITFNNGGTGPLIPDATPFGFTSVNSDIAVGTAQTIQGLSLQLSGFSHTFAQDLVFTLARVGGGGPLAVFALQGGDCDFVIGNTYDFAAGGTPLPDGNTICGGGGSNPIPTGTYAPNSVILPTAFNFQSTSGTWRLNASDRSRFNTSNSGWTWSITFTVPDAGIPEPATFFPVFLGLAGLGLAAFRRRT